MLKINPLFKYFFTFSILVINNIIFASDEQKQANNPLANLTALNFQNYSITDISQNKQSGNTTWVRFVKPIGKFLVRASLPYTTMPISRTKKDSGLSDFNIFAVYTFDTGNPSVSFGIGPMLVAPTASPSILGAGKWQGGVATVYFNGSSNVFQFGGLLTYQADFAGQRSRNHTSILAFQPFGFIQLGKGVYLRTAPVWSFDLINDTHVIPIGLGLGKVIKSGKTVYNVFVEPQISASTKGSGYPRKQIYAALNLQFY